MQSDVQNSTVDDPIHSECSCGCGDDCEECLTLSIDGNIGKAIILCDCDDGPFCICPTRSMLRFDSMASFFRSRGGELSDTLDFGSFNWDDSEYLNDVPLDKLMRVALVRDTGDWYAMGEDGVCFLGRISAGVPASDVLGFFREWEDNDKNGPGQPLSWFQARIDDFNHWWPKPIKIPDRVWDMA